MHSHLLISTNWNLVESLLKYVVREDTHHGLEFFEIETKTFPTDYFEKGNAFIDEVLKNGILFTGKKGIQGHSSFFK